MRQRLILFDVDGTLVETGGAGKRALHRAFAAVFRPGDPGALDWIAAETADVRFAGMTDPVIVQALGAALGVDARPVAARTAIESHYIVALRDEMVDPAGQRRVVPGIPALLTRLDADPEVALGLVTGNVEPGARLKLDAFGLNAFFADGGFGSDHADRRQVARAAVERASRRTGRRFDPADVTVVGDTEHDIDCAQANGYRSVAITSHWVRREVLEQARPDAILEAFDDGPATLKALRGS